MKYRLDISFFRKDQKFTVAIKMYNLDSTFCDDKILTGNCLGRSFLKTLQ